LTAIHFCQHWRGQSCTPVSKILVGLSLHSASSLM